MESLRLVGHEVSPNHRLTSNYISLFKFLQKESKVFTCKEMKTRIHPLPAGDGAGEAPGFDPNDTMTSLGRLGKKREKKGKTFLFLFSFGKNNRLVFFFVGKMMKKLVFVFAFVLF